MKKMRKASWLGLLGIVMSGFSVYALAYEIDNFSRRDELKRDALPALDREVNRILTRAAQEANRESPRYCNRQLVRMEILRWIRPDPVGQLEVWANFTNEFDSNRIPFKDSIYGDLTFFDSPVLWAVGIFASMRLNGHVVGVDKIGHFFFQGLDYYDSVRDGHEIDIVLDTEHAEDGVWGLQTSGVKSYADMAANYGGYKFWSTLTTGEEPYIRCEKGIGWVKVRNFTWADYVNDAWDEGLNCSEFRTAMIPKIKNRMQAKGLQCPVRPDACERLSKVEKASHFTSPACKSFSFAFRR